jgi:predicted nucleotidyltransferase
MANKKQILGTLSQDDTVITYKNKEYPVLLKRITGSRLYGTQYEKGEHPFEEEYVSDYDFRGIFIAPTQDRLSLKNSVPEQIKIDDGEDTEIYDILKFFELAIDNNPNVMDILFGDEESTLFASDVGREILDNKHLFISQKAKESFNGYALQQLYRMKQHHRWAKEYPEIYEVEALLQKSFDNQEIDFQWIADYFSGDLAKKITNEDSQKHNHLDTTIDLNEFISLHNIEFDLHKFVKPHIFSFMSIKDLKFKKIEDTSKFKDLLSNKFIYSQLNDSMILLYETGLQNDSLFTREGTLKNATKKISPDLEASFISTINRSGYKNAAKEIKSIWEWKVNRNEKRAKLEAKFGYDVKHGMHLYRLLNSAKALLLTGTYTPRLKGDDLILAKDILSGKVPYLNLIEMAENLSKELNKIISDGNTPLQKVADINAIDSLLMRIYAKY